jgi:hypothetical protein
MGEHIYEYKENRICGDFNSMSQGGEIELSLRFLEDKTGPLCIGDQIIVADHEGNRCIGEITGFFQGFTTYGCIRVQVDIDTWEGEEDEKSI